MQVQWFARWLWRTCQLTHDSPLDLTYFWRLTARKCQQMTCQSEVRVQRWVVGWMTIITAILQTAVELQDTGYHHCYIWAYPNLFYTCMGLDFLHDKHSVCSMISSWNRWWLMSSLNLVVPSCSTCELPIIIKWCNGSLIICTSRADPPYTSISKKLWILSTQNWPLKLDLTLVSGDSLQTAAWQQLQSNAVF